MANPGDGKKTPAERAELEARDLRLQRGIIAKDRALTDEAFKIIRANLGRIAKKRARWLLREERWKDCCQSVFELIARWRDEGGDKLRESESLWFLTIRALKQVAEKFKNDKNWAALAFSLDKHPTRSQEQAELEEEAAGSVHAPQRFVPTERHAMAKEQWGWVEETSLRLSEEDRQVIVAIGDVDAGEAATLGEALGIKDGAARMRKQRLLERLARAAITEGNREMARRCAGKKYADALELLYVAEPGADHRIDELMLLRDGELETAKKIELEKHMESCPGCKRTVRTLAQVEESVLAVLLLAPPDFDFSRFLPRAPLGGARFRKAVGIGAAAVLAATLALTWWLMREQAEPPPPPKPPAIQKPVTAHPRPQLLSAPIAEPVKVDGGTGR